MASIEITVSGVLYDKLARTTRPVVLIGEASLTGVGVGGGPIVPPDGGGSQPPGIWPGPGDPDFPGGGGSGKPPGIWGPTDPRPNPPIYLPPQVPPGMQPPEVPPPGSPTTPVPPPAGSAGWPVQPIAVPSYVIMWYPGVGPVVVTPPAGATPQK